MPAEGGGPECPKPSICDAIRTPVGRYGGALSSVRADDLAAVPLEALMQRNGECDWTRVDDVIIGCANQAGEDNRNVARMAALLAGLPVEVPGTTINRLCGSGIDAVGMAARAIRAGDCDLHDRGRRGEHEPRALRYGKAESAFSRQTRSSRHDHRLAFRQPEDEADPRHPLHAADGRQRGRRSSRSAATTRTPSPR